MVRIGVHGVGGMGNAHCGAVKTLSDVCELSAVYDVREEAVAETAEKHDTRGFTDLDEFLDQVDGVIVATPPWYHKEATVAAAQRGKHVLVEKPMAADIEDCDAMNAACEEAGVYLMLAHVLRFYPVHQLGKEMVDNGEIGDIVYLEADYAGPYSGRREPPTTWFGKMGGLLENGVHKSDFICWFGGEPQDVAAEVGSYSAREDWEDWTLSLVRFAPRADAGEEARSAGGPVGMLRWGSILGARGSTDTLIDGTKGSMRLSIAENKVHILRAGQSWEEVAPSEGPGVGVAGEDRHFVECIANNTPPSVDGLAGRRSVEVILATYQSAKEGVKVRLPMGS